MAGNFWLHRYGYTDFHELDLSWILEQMDYCLDTVETLNTRVATVENAVDALDVRLTLAEGKISTLEGKMSTAEDDIASLKNRATALENAEILDATMVKSIDAVTASASDVDVAYTVDAYTDGTKSATASGSKKIPAVSTTTAGVMLPADKVKVNAFTVDGSGNALFGGTVAGSSPSANNDYATKQYVDNLAITGSASVTSATLTPSSDHGTVTYGAGAFKIYRYGAMRWFTCGFSINGTTSDINNNGIVLEVPLASGDLPPVNTDSIWVHDQDNEHTFQAIVSNTSSGIYVYNRGGAKIETGDYIWYTQINLVWMVE